MNNNKETTKEIKQLIAFFSTATYEEIMQVLNKLIKKKGRYPIMARNIFLVDAFQVDGQGAYAHISGYPKTFDSADYSNNVDVALKRACGSFASTWSGFCSVDNKQIQLVTLTDIFGNQLDRKLVGNFPAEQPAE